MTARGVYTRPSWYWSTYGRRTFASTAANSSCSAVGAGVTNNSPRTTSYLFPSSGSRCSSANVQRFVLAAAMGIVCPFSARCEERACVEDGSALLCLLHRHIADGITGLPHVIPYAEPTLGGCAESRATHAVALLVSAGRATRGSAVCHAGCGAGIRAGDIGVPVGEHAARVVLPHPCVQPPELEDVVLLE